MDLPVLLFMSSASSKRVLEYDSGELGTEGMGYMIWGEVRDLYWALKVNERDREKSRNSEKRYCDDQALTDQWRPQRWF